MKVYLSPSKQFRNIYAYGNTTEKEQCERIASYCAAALKRCGVEVVLEPEVEVEQRCINAKEYNPDLYVIIHTNAFSDRTVAGTRMFYNKAGDESFKACQAIFGKLNAACSACQPDRASNCKPYPTLYEMTYSPCTPVYCECEFHSNPTVAKWIIENVKTIGEAIAEGICTYFNVKYVAEKPVEEVKPTLYRVQVGAYANKKNAEKMRDKLKALGFSAIIKTEN